MAKIRINRRKDYKEQLKLYLNLTKSLNAKVKKLFKKTARQAEKEYLKYNDMYYFFLEDFSDDLYKILSNHYRSVITASSERIIKQREEKAEGNIDKIVDKYINENTATKVTEISETTRQNIKRSIKKKISEGESIPVIAKEIRQNNGFKPYRATMIARTETHMAMNYANDEISKTLGFKDPVKEWNSSIDDRTRGWHKTMNGRVVKQDEMFEIYTPVGKGNFAMKYMKYTGDPNGGALNVVNCRCFTLRYDSEDEVIGATPKPVSPVLPINVETVAVATTTSQAFVGFGYKTKLEKEYLDESFKKGDVPDKLRELPAKFDPVDFKQKEKGGAFFKSDRDGQVDHINMPSTYKDYNKIAVTRHEYGHNMDFQAMQFLVYDRRRTDNPRRSITGWGTGTDQIVTAKNKVSAKAIKLRAEVNATNRYNMQKLRFVSQVYSKEVLEDAIALEKMIKAKAINDYSSLRPKLIAHREQIKKKYKVEAVFDETIGYAEERLIFSNNSEKMAFLDDMFEDGIFTRKELKTLFGNDVNVPISLDSELIKFNYFNKNKLFGDSQNVGVGGKLEEVAEELLYLKDNARRDIIKKDVAFFEDYVGAITKEKVGSGHGVSYYTDVSSKVKMGRRVISENQTTEAYAEYIALRMSKYNKLWENKMTEYAPRTKAGFDELTEEMLKLPNQKNQIVDKRSVTFYQDQE